MATAASLPEYPGLSLSAPSWLPASEQQPAAVSTGTTLVAIEFDGGVVLGKSHTPQPHS